MTSGKRRRTRTITREEKLLQSHRLEAIGLLAGGIAHDFNTILTTIYGYSELALEGLEPQSEAYHNVTKIIQAVGRARSLTNQILTFSRHAGQARIKVRVKDILQETISFLKPAIPGNVKVETAIISPEAFVSADPTQLFRVFTNIITNALQAMEEKGGTLTVTLDLKHRKDQGDTGNNTESAGKYVTICFEDTGCGMDEATAARIFEPFFTGTSHGKGTGLGLSVVYGIISEIDGDIYVSGKEGKGTVMEVVIPALLEGGEDLGTLMAPKAEVMVIPAKDNEARIISMALNSSGYAVLACDPSGDWMIKAGHSDVVVIVDRSPEMPASGLIFSLSDFGITTPVLVISDFDVWLSGEKELSSAIVKANLFKPVSLKEIISSIDSLLHKPV